LDATQRLLRFGTFELNLDNEELRKSGTPIKLSPQPFRVLALLASHAGQVITREEIRQQIWGDETYVDFEHGLNQCIKQIRTALADNADKPLYVETLPRKGYRFTAPVTSKTMYAPAPNVVESESSVRPSLATMAAAAAPAPAASAAAPISQENAPVTDTPTSPMFTGQRRVARLAWIVALTMVFIAGGLYWRTLKASALTDKDTVVLADFNNTTGDPVFDGTLRQGLSAQLEQSPYLNLLSDAQIGRTLALMEQPKDARLTHEIARDVCQRTGSAAVIEGSIDKLGSEYVLGLRAVSCRDGNTLAEEQTTAPSKEQVVSALGEAASTLRKRLGESLASVQKYDAPAEKVTTASIEALQAYDLGYKAHVRSDFGAAIPLFQRAISLDPNFAMAYARLATSYLNVGETTRAMEAIDHAYELRLRVSEREKFYIAGRYATLTGELEKARRTYELWAQSYPRDPSPLANLYAVYIRLGNYDAALNAMQQAMRLNPANTLYFGNLISAYTYLDRLDDARATAQQATAHKISAPILAQSLYMVDFLAHDPAAMEKDSAVAAGNSVYEDVMLQFESDTAAYYGKFSKARELTQRACQSAVRNDARERASLYLAAAALREALAGNLLNARQEAKTALALANGKDESAIAAMALALAGDTAGARKVSDELNRHFPQDTILKFDYTPMLRAAIALGNRDAGGGGAEALEALNTDSYELGAMSPDITFALYPLYLRGQAYLALQRSAEAAAQFRKILAHPGVALNQSIAAQAHLGLGRALALSGDTSGARRAYQDFLALWKEADPETPLLQQAKAEYAKL